MLSACVPHEVGEPPPPEDEWRRLRAIKLLVRIASVDSYNIGCGWVDEPLFRVRFVDLHKKPRLQYGWYGYTLFEDYEADCRVANAPSLGERVIVTCKSEDAVRINGHPWLVYDDIFHFSGDTPHEGEFSWLKDGRGLFWCGYSFTVEDREILYAEVD